MLRTIGCLGAALVVAGVAILGWQVEYGTEHSVTFTVKSLDDQSNGSSGHKYLVFTTSGTEYEDTDSWLHGKTDSSDIYNWLTVGHTYNCTAYGWRNHITSSYEDLLDGCRDITPGVPSNLQTVP